ncbi:MAG: aldehyde reductase [Roseitalea sp.]|jgi:dihydroflavonol-4-reductase|nr:aldehyde reductase [Roseitalea sp.]MBO6721710.1 aldehyde reductase [Roseitalea sp.]MBO6743501.1 aldehyde reductase [Roseitalea sp.]
MTQRVVLTGASGFIAKHIVLQLLNAGFAVHGTIRSLKRADEVRDAVRTHLDDAKALDRLTFAELDLSSDDGWSDALEGADMLMHTASPFPLAQPKDEEEVIRPAVDGTLRALKAAKDAGVKRVILTSSMVSVMEKDAPDNGTAYTAADWSDVNSARINPYGKSKTLAERAAWDFVANEAPDMELTAINPGLVLGPALDAHYGTSLGVVERVLAAKDPMLPNFGLPAVDVRDVADMHVQALSMPASIGKRLIAVSDFIWFPEIADMLAKAYPDRKITTRRAPNFAIRLMALFDSEIRTIAPNLDVHKQIDNSETRSVLAMDFRPVEEAVRASAESIVAHGKG